MSNETTETPKKKFSILTDAAMKAKAKMTTDENAIESDGTAPKKMNMKMFALGVGAATAGIAAVYGALKLINANISEVEPDSDETSESTD
jgi:hypothetical protein